jgi:hypothetical protein
LSSYESNLLPGKSKGIFKPLSQIKTGAPKNWYLKEKEQ